jgi:heterodisulfide reductase subunit D
MDGLSPARSADPAEPLSAFSARQLLEMDACTRCGECLRACDSFRVKGNESTAAMGMIRHRRGLLRREHSLFGRLLHRDGTSEVAWQEFQDGLFACTLCGRCEQFCPVGIRTRDLILTNRCWRRATSSGFPMRIGRCGPSTWTNCRTI